MKRYESLLYSKKPWSFEVLSELCESLIASSFDVESPGGELRMEVSKQLAAHIAVKDMQLIKKNVETYFKDSFELTINSAISDGKSALHIAAELGFADCVEYLVQQRANVNILDELGGQTGRFVEFR